MEFEIQKILHISPPVKLWKKRQNFSKCEWRGHSKLHNHSRHICMRYILPALFQNPRRDSISVTLKNEGKHHKTSLKDTGTCTCLFLYKSKKCHNDWRIPSLSWLDGWTFHQTVDLHLPGTPAIVWYACSTCSTCSTIKFRKFLWLSVASLNKIRFPCVRFLCI